MQELIVESDKGDVEVEVKNIVGSIMNEGTLILRCKDGSQVIYPFNSGKIRSFVLQDMETEVAYYLS